MQGQSLLKHVKSTLKYRLMSEVIYKLSSRFKVAFTHEAKVLDYEPSVDSSARLWVFGRAIYEEDVTRRGPILT